MSMTHCSTHDLLSKGTLMAMSGLIPGINGLDASETIAECDLPQAVAKTFHKNFPHAKIQKISKHRHETHVDFEIEADTSHGSTMYVFIDADGHMK